MRFLIIFLMFAACPLTSFAYTFTTYNPSGTASGFQANPADYSDYPRMTQIEQILFNRGFDGDNIYSRLSRVEKKVFNKTYQNSDLNWRVENILANIDTTAMYNISSSELGSIEQKVLGRRYVKEKPEARIARLEQQIFGTIQGGALDERYELIRKTALTYNNIASAAFPAGNYYSQGMPVYQSGVKGAIKNILGTLVGSALPYGTMTGFTPQISPSPYCYDPYGFGANANSGINRWYQTNTGYYNQNSNYGTGSGVTILDN